MWLSEESAGLSLYPPIVTPPAPPPPPPQAPVGGSSQPDQVRAAVRLALYTQESIPHVLLDPPPPPPPSSLPFPRIFIIGIGGDQGYAPTPFSSQVTGKVLSSTGFFQESAYSNPVPWLGRADYCIIGGQYEGWDNSGTRDRGLLVDAIQQITNVSGFKPCSVYQYNLFEELAFTSNPYPSITAYWGNGAGGKNWLLYTQPNQAGSPAADFFNPTTAYSTNWAVAWPGTVNGVAADQQISPGRATATLDGSPEDLPQNAAAYFIEEQYARHSSFTGVVSGTIPASAYSDPRWSANDANKAPNLAGIFQDNLFGIPQTSGDYDLANFYTANFNYSSVTPTPWLLRGAQHFGTRFNAIMSKCYPTRTFNWIGNIGQLPIIWFNNKSTWTTLTSGLTGLKGGVLESLFGLSSSFGAPTYGGTVNAILGYQACMDLCIAPKLVAVLTRVATLTSQTDFALARYSLAAALTDDGYFGCSLAGYAVGSNLWLDEFGGNPGTDIPKGWLGLRNGARTSAAAVSGVWIIDFQHGTVLLNPSGNAAQTITAAQINAFLGKSYSYRYIAGAQDTVTNPGGAFSSVALAAGPSAQFLKH